MIEHENILTLQGRWLPPKQGKITADVVCKGSAGRIGVIRVMKDLGPVLWSLSLLGDDLTPTVATPILELFARRASVQVWCPECGVSELDGDTLMSWAQWSGRSPKRHKYTV
jgi:hypothetical protein